MPEPIYILGAAAYVFLVGHNLFLEFHGDRRGRRGRRR